MTGADEIKKHLDEAYDTLLNSVYDRSLIEGKIYFAGGCIASLIQGEPVNDYDIYFFKEEDKERFLDFASKKGKLGQNIRNIAKTKFALTTQLDYDVGKIYQFITKFTGIPEDMINRFDFVHCMNFYNPVYEELCMRVTPQARNKQLVFNPNSPYPVRALMRMKKFLERGYSIDDDEIAKIAVEVSKLSLSDSSILKEQTIGMYVNTFHATFRYSENDEQKEKNLRKQVKYVIDGLI